MQREEGSGLRKKTALKIMALLQYCLIMIMFAPVAVNATGINNYQTVLEAEKQKTLQMLEQAKRETNEETLLLKKELETSKRCATERLKTIVSLVVLTRHSLIEREELLSKLRDTKRILESKKNKKEILK